MYKTILLSVLLCLQVSAIEMTQTPINFGETRVELTKQYIKDHYKLDVQNIKIIPKIIVIHHTAIDDFNESLSRFTSQTLPSDRPEITKGGSVNVSTHFMIEQNGTIHQLMPLDIMARHVIGLNYNSIGIENVGGAHSKDNLTPAQLKANIELINELKKKFPTIEYVIGHYEYKCLEKSPLWLEADRGYRTYKDDPSKRFMREVREKIEGFKGALCAKETDD
ncbi:peptidoglycan recognition family protein [Sulfurimonas sp.]|uniref:N-acetylmuramoyl-L-alanine amidase n=1 Tax=Sulfurimonas sp. TaxID=2022749 RepID=UPI0025D74BBA|nr:peptidoglycan recognition family protein [Sulfurimonas sp.]